MYKTPVAVAGHRISNRLIVFWSSTSAETVTEATFRRRLLPFAHPVKQLSSMSSSSTVRSGSCLCKSIKYEIIGDPITFRICHCMNCRKATGSAFMSNLVFSKEKVRVFEGEEHLKFYRDNDTSSGFSLDRYFCINCGSNMFLQSNQQAGNAIRIVTLGSLDSPTDWVPKTELWAEHRQHWIKGIELQKKTVKL